MRSRLVLVGVALALVTACSDSSPDATGAQAPVSPPAPTTASPSNAPVDEPAPVKAYLEYVRITNSAYADPDLDKWQPRLAEVLAPPELILTIDDLYQAREDGVRRVGGKEVSPQLTSQSSERAVIEDCVDLTGLEVVQRGEPVQLAPDQLRRYRLTAIVERTPEGWRVTEVRPHRGQPC